MHTTADSRINASKVTDEKNPCAAEGRASQKCLSNNNYYKPACQLYFDNYNNCKKFWGEVIKARKRNGLEPQLPPSSEREAFKAKYKETGKIPMEV